jgi:3-oxoacyl-[acyl-carrier-protein] synthase II
MTDPRPDGLGVKLCIEAALRDAQIPKERVNYVNAHATSTLAGDLAEINALRSAFGDHLKNVKINATKSMIGHCLGAAGGLEAVATIQAIRTGMLHPTINLDDPEDAVKDLDMVPHQAQPLQIDAAISNSFGFGGHNSTLIFAPYIP